MCEGVWAWGVEGCGSKESPGKEKGIDVNAEFVLLFSLAQKLYQKASGDSDVASGGILSCITFDTIQEGTVHLF